MSTPRPIRVSIDRRVAQDGEDGEDDEHGGDHGQQRRPVEPERVARSGQLATGSIASGDGSGALGRAAHTAMMPCALPAPAGCPPSTSGGEGRHYRASMARARRSGCDGERRLHRGAAATPCPPRPVHAGRRPARHRRRVRRLRAAQRLRRRPPDRRLGRRLLARRPAHRPARQPGRALPAPCAERRRRRAHDGRRRRRRRRRTDPRAARVARRPRGGGAAGRRRTRGTLRLGGRHRRHGAGRRPRRADQRGGAQRDDRPGVREGADVSRHRRVDAVPARPSDGATSSACSACSTTSSGARSSRRVVFFGARRGRVYILFTLAHSLVNGLDLRRRRAGCSTSPRRSASASPWR